MKQKDKTSHTTRVPQNDTNHTKTADEILGSRATSVVFSAFRWLFCAAGQAEGCLPDHVGLAIKQDAVVADPRCVREVILAGYEVEDTCCPVSNQ